MKMLAPLTLVAMIVSTMPPANAQQGQGYPQGNQQGRGQPQGQAPMSPGEAQMRGMLTQQSMGFGGIFRPTMDGWMRSPSAQSSGPNKCGGYSDQAAQQACKSGNGWAADRLQNKRSTGSERAWYNR